MSIESEKIELLKLILETEDEAIIQKLKFVFEKPKPDFWDELPDSVKESINRGLEDVAAGHVHNHEDVMLKIKKGFNFSSIKWWLQ